MTARDPQAIAAAIRAAGVPDLLNLWLGVTPEQAAADEARLRQRSVRSIAPALASGDNAASIDPGDPVMVEADRRWRNWLPTREGGNQRPQLRSFVREVRQERAVATDKVLCRVLAIYSPESKITPKTLRYVDRPSLRERVARSIEDGELTPADERLAAEWLAAQPKTSRAPAPEPTKVSAPATAVTPEDDTMKKAKKTKAKALTAKQRGKSANTSTTRAIAADARARKATKQDQLAEFITGMPRTSAAICAEFGWLAHSARAAISGLKKPVKDGGKGLNVVTGENGSGDTTYTIPA